MTDAEYQRIVKEHQARKKGGGTDPDGDPWAGFIERMESDPLKVSLVRWQIYRVGSVAREANGFRSGPFDATIHRTEALDQRAERLPPRQISDETLQRIVAISHRIKADDPPPEDPVVLDQVLAEIEGELR